jgi:hypothetical protein
MLGDQLHPARVQCAGIFLRDRLAQGAIAAVQGAPLFWRKKFWRRKKPITEVTAQNVGDEAQALP